MPTLQQSSTLQLFAQGRGYGNTLESGPGGVAGGNTGASVTISDPRLFGLWRAVMNSATPAITLPKPVNTICRLRLDQDATGGRIPTFLTPSGAVIFPAGTFSPNQAALARNFVGLYSDGVNWYLFPETTGLAFVTAAAALAITGTPLANQVLTATGANAAHWA